ncbi:MAG: hypothetical protein CMK07_03905 [Ponticaulis sp.]|nr:hypothetical protein [Ponticaulis sp.]
MADQQTDAKRTQKRSRLTFARIQECAEAIILNEGFGALTMRRLAEVSDVGIGTIYGHFSNRDDLVRTIYGNRLKDKLKLIEDSLLSEGGTDAEAALLYYFQAAIEANAMSQLDLELFSARQHTPSVTGIVAEFEHDLHSLYLAFFTRHSRNASEARIKATTRFNMILEHSLLQAESVSSQEELLVLQHHHAGMLGYLLRDLNIPISPDFEQKLRDIVMPAHE